MSSPLYLARAAYQAYGETVDFKNYQGLPMPAFDELPERIRDAWVAAADRAVLSHASDLGLDEREAAQVAHAVDYAERHKNAGIPGHGMFMLISKLYRHIRRGDV